MNVHGSLGPACLHSQWLLCTSVENVPKIPYFRYCIVVVPIDYLHVYSATRKMSQKVSEVTLPPRVWALYIRVAVSVWTLENLWSAVHAFPWGCVHHRDMKLHEEGEGLGMKEDVGESTKSTVHVDAECKCHVLLQSMCRYTYMWWCARQAMRIPC